MAFLLRKEVLGLVQVSVLLLSSFIVLGNYNEEEISSDVSFALTPHYLPAGHPPVGAPPPHKGHHHHPKHPPPPPPAAAKPPVKPPSPPAKPPSPPPPHSKPPTHQPPPAKPPSPPPAAKPPTPPPVHPVRPRRLVAVQGVVYCKSCKYVGIDTFLGATPLVGATVRLSCNNTKYHLVQDGKTDKNGYFLIAPQKVTTAGSHKCKVFLLSSPLATCKVPTNLHFGRTGAILMPAAPSKKPVKKFPFELFTVGPFAFEPSKKCKY